MTIITPTGITGINSISSSGSTLVFQSASGTSPIVTGLDNISSAGVITATRFVGDITGNVNSTGVSTIATLNVTQSNLTRLNVSGVSTFSTGPVLIGSGSSTGTASQPLQVTGSAYVSGSLGIGTISAATKLDVRQPSSDGGSSGSGIFYNGDDSATIWRAALRVRHNLDTTIVSGSSIGIDFEPLSSTGSSFYGAAAIKGVRENATANNQNTALTFWTRSGASNNTTDTEKLRIFSGGQLYVGQYTNAYDNPGRFSVSNGSRVTTTSGAYVPSNGGIVDYARYELISTCVTSFPSFNNKIMAQNGAPLFIDNVRSTWSHYSNLPNYLIGSLTHDCINQTPDGSGFSFTLACTMTVFLLRDNSWNPVDLTGWTLIESGGQIGVNAISSGRLYVKTLPAGSYTLDNNSAMYFWLI